MDGLQSVIAQKVYPVIDWIAVKISGFVDVSSANMHLMLIGVISLYLASMINGRDRLGVKFWGIGIGLFFLFKYLGF